MAEEKQESTSKFASILAGLSNIINSGTGQPGGFRLAIPSLSEFLVPKTMPSSYKPGTNLLPFGLGEVLASMHDSVYNPDSMPWNPGTWIRRNPGDQGPPNLGGKPTGPEAEVPAGPTRFPNTRSVSSAFPGIELNQPGLPTPPLMDAPPQMGGTPGLDFTGMNKWLDQGNPASSHMNAVLGGFARGAAGVSPAAPGAFAQTLAAAGAGGAAGYGSSADAMNRYAMTRAGTDLQQQQLRLEHAKEQNRIAFENAKLVYDTNVKNKLIQYEHETKKAELAMPKVQANANGIIVQQPDASGKVSVNFYPTKSNQEHLEGLKATAQVLGLPGPFSEALELKTISEMYPNNPVLAQTELRRAAVNRVIQNGAGAAVFGPAYETAAKKAGQIIQQMNPTLTSKPELYQQEIQRIIAGQLISQPWIHEDKWLALAAPHSMIARAMMGTKPTPSAADAAKTLIPNAQGKLDPLEAQ